MSVYIDDLQLNFGRMKMCHMIADTTEELLAMADRIGIKRKWIQHHGSFREHFDICQSKRKLAIEYGAHPITRRELAKLILVKREYVRTTAC